MKRFNPFLDFTTDCVGENFTLQGFDARDIRNEAVRGLDFEFNGRYLDFLEENQDEEILQELIWEECEMGVDEIYNKAQIEMAEKGETELIQKLISCCEQCYSQKCEEIADRLDEMQRSAKKIRKQ